MARATQLLKSRLVSWVVNPSSFGFFAAMKADVHPKNYRTMIFRDSASGQSFLSKSCANTNLTATWEDGQEYPLYLLGISAFTHPFYTGQQKFVDTAGRVDKFQQRLAKTQAAQAALADAAGKKKKK
jgi:large subunit ribosomal protein L31